MHYCGHFVVEIDEISSLNGEFYYNLMICDSGILFGQSCRLRRNKIMYFFYSDL